VVFARSRKQLFDRTVQVHDHPSGRKPVAIRRTLHDATTSRHDYALQLSEFVNDMFLAVAKTALSLHIEYPRYLGACTAFDFLIRVIKRHTKPFSQQPAYCAFPHSHESNHKNILLLHKKTAPNWRRLV